MNHANYPEVKEIMNAVHYRPAVSVILPFEPKMHNKSDLAYSVHMAAANVEAQLKDLYPADIVHLMTQKLQALIKGLNYNTYKKSVALFLSPVFEKVLYLEIPVSEKVIVDESFEIRDLLYCKKQTQQYLVLLLSAKESKILLGHDGIFVRLLSNNPGNIETYDNDVPGRVANFSDPKERKEMLMDKFLHHIDNALAIIQSAYHLPLFVAGTERIAGHFKKITRQGNMIVDYVHGNYENATEEELKDILNPLIADWNQLKQKDLMNQLEDAAGKQKLSAGIREVWKEAANRKGRLLLVEKDYMVPAERGGEADIITELAEPYNRFSYIRDAVDDVIEKVLENGGDVEFVQPGGLAAYDHIALLQYY